YFTASTDVGPSLGAEMSGLYRPVTRSVYVVVLGKDLPSPLAPESDEEKAEQSSKKGEDAGKSSEGTAEKEKEKEKKEPVKVRIDLESIDQRILALPIPAQNYTGLLVGKAGTLFLLESPPVPRFDEPVAGPPSVTLHRFDLEKRKTDKV